MLRSETICLPCWEAVTVVSQAAAPFVVCRRRLPSPRIYLLHSRRVYFTRVLCQKGVCGCEYWWYTRRERSDYRRAARPHPGPRHADATQIDICSGKQQQKSRFRLLDAPCMRHAGVFRTPRRCCRGACWMQLVFLPAAAQVRLIDDRYSLIRSGFLKISRGIGKMIRDYDSRIFCLV